MISASARAEARALRAYLLRIPLVPPPQPAQRVRQDRAAVTIAVEALPDLEAVVVPRKRQRFREGLVGERPVAVRVVQIVRAILQEHADRLARGLAYERLVVVSAFPYGLSARDVREASAPREHLAELVRPFPRDGERADAAAAGARDRAARGVVPKLQGLLDFREDLLEQ